MNDSTTPAGADDNPRWTLRWAHGEASVQAMGGMLAPVRFELGGGRSVSPLHVAPWGDDPQWPGLMRALRGEWPCVPFGATEAPAGLPDGYTARACDDDWRHGYGANHRWHCVERGEHALTLALDYPAEHAIERLERRIEAAPDAPALTVSLTVHARRDVTLPLALHPTFAVPAPADGDPGGPDAVEVLACPYRAVHTYPVAIEPDHSRIVPDRRFASIADLATRDGGHLDLTRLPLAQRTEELVQLEDCRPPFVLRYPASEAEVSLDWSTDDFPDAVMWISNGGRDYAPWSGRNYALGVEPVRGFFDLGRVASPPPGHPLAHRTGFAFEAGAPRTIRYRLSARRL